MAEAAADAAKNSPLTGEEFLKVEELLKSWETTVAKHVTEFANFAGGVAQLDMDLCHAAVDLHELEQQQQKVESSQQEIDATLDEMEKHQLSLASIIRNVEEHLTSRLTPDESAAGENGAASSVRENHTLPTRIMNLTAALDDAESSIETLVNTVNKLQDDINPGTFGKLLTLLNVQRDSLQRLETELEGCKQRKAAPQHIEK